MFLREIKWDGVDWIDMAQDRDQWKALVNFHFSESSRLALRSTQPRVRWVPGALSPGVKRPGREVDHSPPTSAEIKKNVDLYIHSPYAFMA
jgi:hypothetical protein